MALTVGIPLYNEEELLRSKTLELHAFLRQRGEEFEILLGSNGSSDATVSVGERLAAELPEVRFFHLSKVVGLFVHNPRNVNIPGVAARPSEYMV